VSGEIEFYSKPAMTHSPFNVFWLKNPSISMIPPGVGMTRFVGEIFCHAELIHLAPNKENKVMTSNMGLVTSETFYDVIIMKEASS